MMAGWCVGQRCVSQPVSTAQLAFDEVQLVDVAGASILRRVLEHFWRLGGVVVATSNRLPDGTLARILSDYS
jgi:predicted ATPase